MGMSHLKKKVTSTYFTENFNTVLATGNAKKMKTGIHTVHKSP
jgi:hypothetical protein